MRRFAVAASLATLTLSVALAADANLDKLAGVYKRTFPNANIDGDKYQSENILEIVRLSPNTAYIRTHLEFFNGHVCNIAGVATLERDTLVYRGPDNFEGKPCVLSLKVASGKITFHDQDGACTVGTCGARGMYTGIALELKRRRTIRYMDMILNSEQYKTAVKDYEAKNPPVQR